MATDNGLIVPEKSIPQRRKLTMIPPLWTSYTNLRHSLNNSPLWMVDISMWVGWRSFLEQPDMKV